MNENMNENMNEKYWLSYSYLDKDGFKREGEDVFVSKILRDKLVTLLEKDGKVFDIRKWNE